MTKPAVIIITCFLVLALSLCASATVSVNATFLSPSGQPVTIAYLTLDLENCGFNVPSIPGLPATMVQKHIQLRPSQLPATIYGNNEITCGNSYSTLWHVTAWADSNTKLAGDLNYDLCSSTVNCLGAATPSWNLAQSQPFSGTPPPPGYISIFGNPLNSQYLKQPNGSTFFWYGNVDFTNANVTGIPSGSAANFAAPPPIGNVTPNAGFFSSLLSSQAYSAGLQMRFGAQSLTNSCNPLTEYQIPSGTNAWEAEAVTGCMITPAGITGQYQGVGIAGYARNDSTNVPTIAVQGIARSTVPNTSVHAGSFVAIDGGIGVPNNNYYGSEDFVISNNVASVPVGHQITGYFPVQPTLSVALLFANVSTEYFSKGAYFAAGVTHTPDSSNCALCFDPVAPSGTNINSQGWRMLSRDTVSGFNQGTGYLSGSGNYLIGMSKPNGAVTSQGFTMIPGGFPTGGLVYGQHISISDPALGAGEYWCNYTTGCQNIVELSRTANTFTGGSTGGGTISPTSNLASVGVGANRQKSFLQANNLNNLTNLCTHKEIGTFSYINTTADAGPTYQPIESCVFFPNVIGPGDGIEVNFWFICSTCSSNASTIQVRLSDPTTSCTVTSSSFTTGANNQMWKAKAYVVTNGSTNGGTAAIDLLLDVAGGGSTFSAPQKTSTCAVNMGSGYAIGLDVLAASSNAAVIDTWQPYMVVNNVSF